MYREIELQLAIATHHEFRVTSEFLHTLGTILAADDWLIADLG
jgi:hypothetical protein